jgi:hypothetical protein
MTRALGFTVLMTLAIFTVPGCASLSTAKKMGSEARAYINLGWIKVIENDRSPMSGYQRLMDELSLNPPVLKPFIAKKGLPAYLRVTGGSWWGYDLAYCEEGKIYQFGGQMLELKGIVNYTNYPGKLSDELFSDFKKCIEDYVGSASGRLDQPSGCFLASVIKKQNLN